MQREGGDDDAAAGSGRQAPVRSRCGAGWSREGESVDWFFPFFPAAVLDWNGLSLSERGVKLYCPGPRVASAAALVLWSLGLGLAKLHPRTSGYQVLKGCLILRFRYKSTSDLFSISINVFLRQIILSRG